MICGLSPRGVEVPSQAILLYTRHLAGFPGVDTPSPPCIRLTFILQVLNLIICVQCTRLGLLAEAWQQSSGEKILGRAQREVQQYRRRGQPACQEPCRKKQETVEGGRKQHNRERRGYHGALGLLLWWTRRNLSPPWNKSEDQMCEVER